MFVRSVIDSWRRASRVACLPSVEPQRATLFGDTGDCLVDLAELRNRAREALQDCSGASADRLRLRICCASDARDIWLMRCDMFQVIAHQHAQSVATSRINELLPAFEGWIPGTLLARV